MADVNPETSATEVTESLVSRKLLLAVRDGVNASGTAKIKTRSYSNLNADASAEAMHATGKALATLTKNELANIYYDDKSLLQEVVAED